MHVDGFIIRMFHDARPPERQIYFTNLSCLHSVSLRVFIKIFCLQNFPFSGAILLLLRVNMYIAKKERGIRPVRPEETSTTVYVVAIARLTPAATTNAKIKFTLQQTTKTQKGTSIAVLIFR